jgi:Acetyltransferase (GNAT) domain
VTVRLSDVAPPDWERMARWPVERAGFARAMRWMGYRPLYAHDDQRCALALVRGGAPVLGRLTARANVYTSHGDPRFLRAVLGALAARGIPHVKVGDTMWGTDWLGSPETWPLPRTAFIVRHTFCVDLAQEPDALARRQDASVRASIRKAQKAGVHVAEVASADGLDAYCALAGETTARVRQQTAYTDYPAAFFGELYRQLVPVEAARFYVATVDGTPLAGAVLLCSADRALYFAGASTRDRRWTALQAPTYVLWMAMLEARRRGYRWFDLGGCTPTGDPGDARHGVYAFKKRWGGDLQRFGNLEVILSPVSVYLQERVIAPLWDRMHPLYFKLLAIRKAGL